MTHLYFAYGSNMSSVAIGRRCPSAALVGTALLVDHQLTFFLEDASWYGGGVAGVVPVAGVHVEGVVYRLDDADLAALDRYEAIDDGDYVRARVVVQLTRGEPVEVWIYLPGRGVERWVAPSEPYLTILLEGAAEHGLSPEHVGRMRAAAAAPVAGADGVQPASSGGEVGDA